MSTNKTRRKNPRVIVLAIVLLVGAIALVAREHRPSFLRPGVRLNAYVTTLDGNVSVVDLVRLRATARIPVGPALSGLREHPTRPEVWGVSTQGGYVFVLDAHSNQVTARIPVGSLPYAMEFSADGSRISFSYTTSLDGKPVPISGYGKTGGADTVADKRINSNTITGIAIRAGKAYGKSRHVVSEGGKVTTVTARDTDANGKTTTAVVVYDKQ